MSLPFRGVGTCAWEERFSLLYQLLKSNFHSQLWSCLFLPLVLSGLVHGFESLLLSLHTFVVVGLLMSGALVLKSDI